MKMRHGGDIATYSKLYSGKLVDFSSNINPLGYPKGLKEYWNEYMDMGTAYPDIKYRVLRKHISEYLKCDPEEVVVGNGAMEIIDGIMNLENTVQICYPSFGEYAERAKVRKMNLTAIPLDEDFKVNIDLLQETLRQNSLLILGNPNNPTGYRIEKEELLKIYRIVRERRGILVLDEAFYEFCNKDYDSIDLFRGYDFDRVVIIRAATKFFALPGVRLGYACTNFELATALRKVLLPWNVNIFADLAGRYIFHQSDYIRASKDWIGRERPFLFNELSKMSGIKVYPGDSNFLLIDLKERREEEALTFFLQRGFLIRTCSGFQGLEDRHIRVAIKEHRDNEGLLQVFREFLNQ